MTKTDKTILGLVSVSTVVILVLGISYATKTQAPILDESEDAKVEVVGSKSHDWGQIDIEGGNVEQTFQIRNVGASDLEISNFRTSCVCTEAQITINGEQSPVFGMHTRSGWMGVIHPGDTADINVVFDPMFHGPQGTGAITRIVSFDTNDSANRTVELRLSGNVVRLDN